MQNIRTTAESEHRAQRAKRVPGSQRRIQLLDNAREIIRRDGVGALTMSALADEVGVTKPIVYKHFRNSEDVVIAILKEYTEGSIRFTARRVRDARTIYDFLDQVIECLFDYIKINGLVVRRITNGFSSSENVDACFLDMQRRSLRVYRHLLLQQGVSAKKASLAAYTLMEMINTSIYEFAQKGDQEDRDTLKELVRGAVRVLVRGQGVRPQVPADLLKANGDNLSKA